MGVLLCRVSNYSYPLYLHIPFRAKDSFLSASRRRNDVCKSKQPHPSHTPKGTTSLHNTCYRLTISSMKGIFIFKISSYLILTIRSAYFRLNLQHRVIRRACGGKLYFAPIYLGDGDRVLESGVGTGTFH